MKELKSRNKSEWPDNIIGVSVVTGIVALLTAIVSTSPPRRFDQAICAGYVFLACLAVIVACCLVKYLRKPQGVPKNFLWFHWCPNCGKRLKISDLKTCNPHGLDKWWLHASCQCGYEWAYEPKWCGTGQP